MIAPLRSEIRLSDVARSLLLNKGYIARLENELVEYFGVSKVLLTHSGRSGLYFLLKALPQKKVYLPAYNCWAVTEAALYAQKEIEYVDIRLDDYNMDVARLRESLVAGSIVVATHQFGIPCDIEAIMELARERNCIVLEDNAPAFGAEVRGKKTGTFGAAGFLSFDYSKTVVSGKGGAILFNDEALYRTVRALHEKETVRPGRLKSIRYMLVALAYSYATHRLLYPCTYALFRKIRGSSSSVPAYDLTGRNESYGLGYDDRRAKLAFLGMQRLEENTGKRKGIVDFYLNKVVGNGKIVPPVIPDCVKAVMVKFPIRLQGFDRDFFYDRCIEQGLDMAFLFPFRYGGAQACPNAGIAADQAMALPVYGALSGRALQKIKRVLDDDRNYAAGPGDRKAAGEPEKRKLLFFTLNYYWMDKEAYSRSKHFISLLRTHDELPETEYSLKIDYKTFLIDLRKTEEELFAAFDAKGARYPINKAIKSGVVVRRAETGGEKRRFYDFYQAFVADPKRKDKILALQENELDRLEIFYAVSAEGEYLGGVGLLPSPDGRYLLYKYAATLHRYAENDLLIWQAIRHAKGAGYSWFDMSWMLPTEAPGSDQYRLFQFKKKFGGELVDFYSYVNLRGPLKVPGFLFRVMLKHLFDDDINTLALGLKKLKLFR